MPLVIYTLLRLALFGAAFGLLYVAGLRGWLLPIVAVVVALAVSYLTLGRPRDAAARWMAGRAEHRAAERAALPKAGADAAHEDAQVDEKLRGTTPYSDKPNQSRTP
ncbi:DUF4229 domain-containing protein [Promicromonospora sp. NPDC057138]|uniref:DUF4229 domain-containing protein n=1 Tax=Promicromonospora sp. NPDC057138 TaxID=3346031 RepID=UPI00363F2163